MSDYQFLSICASLLIIGFGVMGFLRLIDRNILMLWRRISRIEKLLEGLIQKENDVGRTPDSN